MPRPKAIVSWSSGKDSAYVLHVARQQGDLELVGLLTTFPPGIDSTSYMLLYSFMNLRTVVSTLRTERNLQRLPQAALARRMGVSQQMVARLEVGRGREITWGMIGRWSRALGREPSIRLLPARQSLPSRLPRSLYRHFWDTDPRSIDPDRNRAYVIERLLELGDLPAIAWLRSNYGSNKIRQVAAASHRLSPKTKAFARLV